MKRSELKQLIREVIEESRISDVESGSDWFDLLVKFLEQYCANIDPETSEFIDESKGSSDADAFERIYGTDPYNANFISDSSEGEISVIANEDDAYEPLVKFLEEYVANIDFATGEFIDETEGSSAADDFETVFGTDPYNGMFISEDGTILI